MFATFLRLNQLLLAVAFTGGLALTAALVTETHWHLEGLSWTNLFVAGVIIGLLYLLWHEYGRSPADTALPRRFSSLGSGYGLIEALRVVTRRVDQLRLQQATGLVDAEQAAAREAELLEHLAAFYADKRWREILRLKNRGHETAARQLAAHLRRDHGLG